MSRRPDPYAIVDDPGPRRPLRSVIAAILALLVFLLLLGYVAWSVGDDDNLPKSPGNNQPRQP